MEGVIAAVGSRMLMLGVVAWGSGVGVGACFLLRYEATPGVVAPVVERWPNGVSLTRDPIKPTLIMLVHPNCGCTRASLSELEVLMSHCPNTASAYVVFERPVGLVDDPSVSDLWSLASGIRGVKPIHDDGVAMARAFHAQTSGQVFLYDTAGVLRFSGGITESRGHAGDNDGRIAIEDFLLTGKTACTRTPVFGCALQ